MPTYEYQCLMGHHFERVLPVAEYKTPQTCECGADSVKLVSLPLAGYVQRECRYDSPIDGRPITSWAQRKDDLARHGCQEYDPGMKDDYDRRVKRSEEAMEKSVEATIEAEIDRMPARKKEQLHSELNAGANATIERGLAPISTTRDLT